MLYELKVVIKRIDPPIWRTIQVPPRTSLKRMHKILQTAMGWTNSHLHLFKVGDKEYGELSLEWDFEVLDESKITLMEIFADGNRSFQYEYDLGDDWIHEVTLERQIEGEEETKPGCTAGARACPPEDCGGATGYQYFLEAISDPDHEEHDSLLEWIGKGYDPEAFDLAAVDRALKRLR